MWLLALPEDILDHIEGFLNVSSSVSFSIYRHDMIRHGEIKPYDCWFLDYIRKLSYFGGRVELFRLGVVNGPVYYLDFTSLYPYHQ